MEVSSMYLGALCVGRSGLYFHVGRYLPEVRLEGNLVFQAQKYCCVVHDAAHTVAGLSE